MALRFVYTMFTGILLVAFVGVGIAAFYPGPERPEVPFSIEHEESICEQIENKEDLLQIRQEQEEFDENMKVYQTKLERYNRETSIISLIAAILILIISLTLFKKILIIADGLLLGGVLTLIYSIIRGFGSDDNIFRFSIVSVGLVISFFLGYIKFIRPSQAKRK
jgi:hypothetical protein